MLHSLQPFIEESHQPLNTLPDCQKTSSANSGTNIFREAECTLGAKSSCEYLREILGSVTAGVDSGVCGGAVVLSHPPPAIETSALSYWIHVK